MSGSFFSRVILFAFFCYFGCLARKPLDRAVSRTFTDTTRHDIIKVAAFRYENWTKSCTLPALPLSTAPETT